MAITIKPADLGAADVLALLTAHAAHCLGSSPPESCHFLAAEGLSVPDVSVWAAYEGETLAGLGALKALGNNAGEIKSMHTTSSMRGRGVGNAILAHIEAEATRRGYTSLWLETGTMETFAPARAMYERSGFAPCDPFGDYTHDPHSAFFTKALMEVPA